MKPKIRALPHDCTLLPLSCGGLLVSPQHAVFCRILPGELGKLRLVVSRTAPLTELSSVLLKDLEAHGFFGPAVR